MRKFESGPAGDAASREGLARLRNEVVSLKATKSALILLKKGLADASKSRFKEAAEAARQALEFDEGIFHAWHLLGIARDKLGDREGALDAYERALRLSPDSPQIANDLGRLAYRMQMWPQAEALFRLCLQRLPTSPEASNNLSALLRREMRYDEGVAVLRNALMADPSQTLLWVSLGTICGDQGDSEQAETFYREALRLNPRYAKAIYNLTGIMFDRGEEEEAIAQCQRAIPLAEAPEDATAMRFALATMTLARGDLTQGWDYYRSRLEPTFTDPVYFLSTRPRWEPGTDIAGRHLMIFGEQGLGDEILFANMLDDILADLGPGGRLTFAVTDRLLPLFRRSYPQINLGAHVTLGKEGRAYRSAPFVKEWEDVDCWAPFGEFLRSYRATIESFPDRPHGFLRPAPERVEHWREVLSQLPGLKTGLLWTSLVLDTNRHRLFSPFELWEPVLRTPGVSFINLQYGDHVEELEYARRTFGVDIFQPPGIDLKNDLDDVAALSAALDLVVGVSNASFNIAAAVGTPSWLLAASRPWTALGTDRYPWYSQVRKFAAPTPRGWDLALKDIAETLAEHVQDGTRLAAAG